jgi:drug/metabolite transporter (DMT)-like permease
MSRGLALLLPYPVLSATVDVYAGHGEQSLDPAVVAAIAFTLTVAVFAVPAARHRPAVPAARHRPATPAARHRPAAPLRDHLRDAAALNVTTALTWISLLYALKFLEPAVVNAVSLAIGPAVTVVAGPLLRRGTSVLAAEAVVAAAVLATIAVLCWGSADGLTSIGNVGLGRGAAGLAATLASGLGSAGTFIYAKRLSEAEVSPQTVLSSRFYLTAAVSWVIAAASGLPRFGASLLPGLVVAVVGVAVPAYLLQLGVRHAEPITVSLIDNLAPVLTYLLQLTDGRLRPSAFSLSGILAITVLITAGVVARARHDARARPAGDTVGASSRRPGNARTLPCSDRAAGQAAGRGPPGRGNSGPGRGRAHRSRGRG